MTETNNGKNGITWKIIASVFGAIAIGLIGMLYNDLTNDVKANNIDLAGLKVQVQSEKESDIKWKAETTASLNLIKDNLGIKIQK